ncbi:MAG: dethiobiotin synthase [Nannocystaceae bacterium]|nr:dethiobiotin synthase [Nannocystaceae bacterium]
MTERVFFVGTNTSVGKTALVCSLLRWARAQHLRVAPFKPAQSGDMETPTDVERLLDAAGISRDHAMSACPLTYPEALAPGIAEDPAPFLRPPAANVDPLPDALELARDRLESWELQRQADYVFLEGAGGLHVPMPGGTWQTEWVRALADSVVLVASSGLGTINHTLLTLDALDDEGFDVLGVYFVDPDANDEPSRDDNAEVIATARNINVLGRLPYLDCPDGRGPVDLLTPLLNAMRSRGPTES